MNPQSQPITVRDIMTANPTRIEEDMQVETIYQLFAEKKLSCAPVVDKDNRIQGYVTMTDLQKSRQLFDLREYLEIIIASADDQAKDYLMNSFAFLEGPIDLRAREIMSVNVVTVRPEESIEDLSQKMLERQSHHALVVDDQEQLVGIVSTFDFLKLYYQATPV